MILNHETQCRLKDLAEEIVSKKQYGKKPQYHTRYCLGRNHDILINVRSRMSSVSIYELDISFWLTKQQAEEQLSDEQIRKTLTPLGFTLRKVRSHDTETDRTQITDILTRLMTGRLIVSGVTYTDNHGRHTENKSLPNAYTQITMSKAEEQNNGTEK